MLSGTASLCLILAVKWWLGSNGSLHVLAKVAKLCACKLWLLEILVSWDFEKVLSISMAAHL